MKSNLIRENIPLHTPEWHAYRLKYVNSTDAGPILGLSPYSVAGKVFNEKIGRILPWTEGNKHTFLGLYLEKMIADIWTYYDPTGPEDNYVQNHKEGKIIRTCKKASGYYRNKKYPWLSTSLDNIIPKGQMTALGTLLKKPVPLETKTIHTRELSKWESIPTWYLGQGHVEMLIMEVEYMEIVLFDSDKNFHIYPVEYSKEFGDQILDITHDFSIKVEKAKELMKSLENEQNEEKRQAITYEIDQLEPDSGMNSKAYEEFIKEKYRDGYVKDQKDGNMTDWENAVSYLEKNKAISKVEEEQQLHKNLLLKSMGAHEYISFGEDGQISNCANKKGVRTFRVSLKN